jgi:RimJ/RimL family protein N-acetyltransferase
LLTGHLNMSVKPVLIGRSCTLRPFGADDISERYLGWLTDPEVNRYSRRANSGAVTRRQALDYLQGLQDSEIVLAILHDGHGHVGNIKYGPIDRRNSRADISILIGEPAVWGKGIGAEAVYLLTRHLFEEEGLNRVDAGSVNPGFLRLVEKLGWRREGVLRERVHLPDGAYDSVLVAQLRSEFERRPEFEPALETSN